MKRNFRRRQRGVVLLVVLSLLTLFTLLMVTFIIVSGQYRQSALSAARASRTDAAHGKLLDNATFALLRDSTDPKNTIRFHSLLFDMYGGDGFVGSVSGVGDVSAFAVPPPPLPLDGTNGNFFDLRINVQAPNPLPPATPTTPGTPLDLAGKYHPLSFVDGYYNGCVLTVVSSSVAQGRRFRVVDYQAAPSGAFPNPSQHVFRLMPIAISPESSNVRPVAGDRVILNGRPFNGTGFGYDSSYDPKLNPSYTLQPNQSGVTSTALLANFVAGDADESYDAVDFQNMALAGIIPTATTIATDGVVVVPSFHRPELVNYWVANDTTKLDQAIMRPMPWNHPDFDGSNRELTLPKGANAAQITDFLWRLRGVDPLTGNRINPWDVDNDGDRIPDSVWVDLGFPVQTMPDGKQVRPLFAFLCVDLDGRINLNTAGSAGHVTGLLARVPTTTLARGAASSALPAGQGLGTAEINPGYSTTSSYPLFKNFDASDQYFTMLSSRYGANGPGASGMDTFAAVKFFEFPTNYFFGTSGKAYSSPPDLFGELALGLDYRGQPTYDTPDVSRTDVLSNSPYEFDVTGLQRGRADYPFTVAELERVLRFNDTGVRQLPDRLTNLTGVAGSASRRRSVTTDSYDVPVPPVLSPSDLRSGFESTTNWQTQFPSYNSGRPLHVTDLLAARLSSSGVAQADINTEIAEMLSFDLRAGTRMDVNRPFGNGLDDNGNGVVDEHGSGSAQQLEADPSVAEQIWATGTYFDHDNDGVIAGDTDAYLARYHFAKHLYVLAMTLKGDGVAIDFDGTAPAYPPTKADLEETARGLAQWAINVVDFRDADSIMTPFEYDIYPVSNSPGPDDKWGQAGVDDDSNGVIDDISEALYAGSDDIAGGGWNVDGNLATNEWATDGLDNDGDGSTDEADEITPRVWGCERPELLITETLAFHDRRTEDLPTDTNMNTQTSDPNPANRDAHFDQRLRPRASLFIELHNPWSGVSRKPAEFYSNGVALQNGILLSKRAPINATNGAPLTGAPVWRMIVVGGDSHSSATLPLDPDDPNVDHDITTAGVQTVDVNTEREIYFTNPTSLPNPSGKKRHWSDRQIDPLQGGGFAVAGSGIPSGNNYVTTIGRRTDAQDDGQTAATTDLKENSTRRIVLTVPAGGLPAHQVRIYDNGALAPTPPDVQPAIAAVINNGGPLSISEPLNGYGYWGGSWDATLASGEGAYATPLDIPFHKDAMYDPVADGGFVDDSVWDAVKDPDPTNNPDAPDPVDRNYFGTNLRTVHLQRLANPLLPWNPAPGMPGYNPAFPVNPYRTVDRARIDLTVFEGVYDPDPGFTPPLPSPRTNDMVPFGGRERGAGSATALVGRKLWNTDETTPPSFSKVGVADTQVFDYYIDHTLGYLNDSYGNRFSAADPVPPGFRGAPKTTTSGTDGEPFPWLTWNNRPFVSQHEMMLVPRSSSSQLLSNFSIFDTTAKPTIYHPTANARQFGHLLNFFATTTTTGVGPNLYRLFDYTHVPSRFMGTETWLDPTTFANGNGTALLHPPFDRVFSFREPGKVNINTIFEQRVWDAIRGPNSTLQDFDTLVDTRRGYDPADPPQWQSSAPYSVGQRVLPMIKNGKVYECSTNGTSGATEPSWPTPPRSGQIVNDGTVVWTCSGRGPSVLLDASFPTFFGNAFRAADAGDLVPVASMTRAGVEATLLRSEVPTGTTATQTDGGFAVTSGAAHVDPNRNPYFRYQNTQRLANLVTTRSNVYAIWVTMGMFEVNVEETSTGSGVFVERLGQEAGRETGSVRRHRAFYIIDRSIPVAFQPGENHNVEQAILLRRVIE